MKGVFVIIDGLGDLPNKQLGGDTPLESAYTPNMDFLATRGKLGVQYPVKKGYSPGSDEAIVSIFGSELKNSSRGRLEAYGAGLEMKKGDLALRVNFATIKKNGDVVDRRAGRTLTDSEARELAKSINKMDFPYEFDFVSTVQHRAVLVIRGDFSDKIAGDDITYTKGKSEEITKIIKCKPLIRGEKAKHTADVLNEFLSLAWKVLESHPINRKRRKKGLLVANYLLVRGPGVEKPKLKQYKNWISTNIMPLEKGFAVLSGMKNFSFDYPPLKGLDAYKNLWKGLRKKIRFSIRVLKKNMKKANYCYIHLKETDLPGHDKKPFEKKAMIEYIDRTLIRYLARIAPPKGIKVLITGDHSTPCKLGTHSADPVPFLIYDVSLPEKKSFGESFAKKGILGAMLGKDLFRKSGFLK